jgi:adenylate cyclase
MIRKLATILATDVVGYSRMMAHDEEATLASLGACRKVLDSLVGRHSGRVFGSAGDSFVAEFASPVEAVRCAVAFQRAIAERNAGLGENARLLFRTGVCVGDVVVENDSLYGDGVNVAVRVEALAQPGGVLVTGETYHLVRRKIDATFEDLGETAVKNLPDPVHVFRVVARTGGPADAGEAAAAEGPKATEAPGPDRPSRRERPGIVVLPFDNLSGDPEQAYFCDGLTQDITTDLSRFHDLFVIAANSAFVYKGRPRKAQQIAAELGVQYLLEGSVRRVGPRLRINVQLIDAETGHHVWAQRFDKLLVDVFSLSDALIRRIVATLVPRLSSAERNRALSKPPQVVDAYDAFLRGAHEIVSHVADWEETDQNLRAARRWFERAIELDPTYARAHGWLAFALVHSVHHGWEPKQAIDRAESLAARAVELAADDYDARWSLASVYALSGRLEMAEAEYRLALDFNPNDAALLADSADTLVSLGRAREAAERVRTAMEINPYHPDWYRWSLGWALHVARDYEASNGVLMAMTRPNAQCWAIMAANHARLAERLRKAKAPDEAAAQLRLAAAAMATYRERTLGSAVEREAASVFFRDPGDRKHWLDGLKLAELAKASAVAAAT